MYKLNLIMSCLLFCIAFAITEPAGAATDSEEELEAAQIRAELAAEEAERAQKKADEAQAAAEALKLELSSERDLTAERFEALLEAQQAQAERRDMIFMVVAGVLLVAMVLGFVLLWRRRSDGGDAGSASHHPGGGDEDLLTVINRPMSEYILDGRDEDGIRYLLRISGDQLSRPEGVTIGRNPKDSPFIINHGDVSRKHARMKAVRNRLFIEDLGSTNGTSVNGQSIDARGPVSVSNGDQIIIGSVVMKLRVMND